MLHHTLQHIGNFIASIAKQTEETLRDILHTNDCLLKLHPGLHSATIYSVLQGGKRLRCALTNASCNIFNTQTEASCIAACAVELIHCYSLIHDDLPSMDDDNMRRGKPSCHKKFGEAQAILAGDALQGFAIQLIADIQNISTTTKLQMVKTLTIANNYMVAGQAMDMDTENKKDDLTTKQLEKIYEYKTASLINASIQLGALASGTTITSRQEKQLKEFAIAMGIAFQITDDILEIGQLDDTDNKPNYVSLFGLEQSHIRVKKLHNKALKSIESFGTNALLLKGVAEYMIKRTY